jgi:nickel transport protein
VSRAAARALALALCCAAAPAAAHQVRLDQSGAEAAVLTLSYADGTPFAYESYELTPAGADVPAQVGRTDAGGRVIFLPGEATRWRLRAFAEDGHGVDRSIEVAAGQPAPGSSAGSSPSPLWAALTGLGVLFGLFGLYQLFLHRRGRTHE